LQSYPEQITTLLLRLAQDRSKALNLELQRLQSRQYPSTGPHTLIKLAVATNEKITKDLSVMLDQQQKTKGIPNLEIEIALRAKTELLAFLHFLMQYVEGADIEHTPIAFIFPLQCLLRKHLTSRSKFDFIVRSSHSYNYKIRPMAEGIREVFSNAGYKRLLYLLPNQFLVIDYPICERRNVLVQCMFVHELSHTLYYRYNLASRLLPNALLNEEEVQRLIAAYAIQRVEVTESKTESASAEVLPRWIIEDRVRVSLQTTVEQWVEELTADALALCLFGPAYFFAFAYFSGPFASMDKPSETHPPDKMRIEFMFDMLLKDRGLGYGKVLDDIAKTHIELWRSYAMQVRPAVSSTENILFSIVTQTIRQLFAHIVEQTKEVTRGKRYSPQAFSRDVSTLCLNLANAFPPNEIIEDYKKGNTRVMEAESILNAGWVYLISGYKTFADLLGVEDSRETINKLYDLVAKGLEYAEIQRQWGMEA